MSETGEEESKSTKQGSTLSRRRFLKLAGLGLLEVGLGLTGCRIVDVDVPPNVPKQDDVPALLEATATAIAQKGEQTSFIEQAGFSKELFERTRHSTYVMQTINH